jgi:hypothetical protein
MACNFKSASSWILPKNNLPRESANQRLGLRGAMLRSRRDGRLRVHIQSLSQMPIAAPVNTSGGQVSRNNTNSGIGRSDGLRTLLRRTAGKVRWKVAFSYTKGTMHQCLLGNITENEPWEVTGPRSRLRVGMACFSSEMGHPLKNNQEKTTTLGQQPIREACDWSGDSRTTVRYDLSAGLSRRALGRSRWLNGL